MKNYSMPVMWGAICSFVLMAGCTSSELVDIWSDSSFQPPPLNSMLVISVGRTPVQRRIWEDAFSKELEKHGVATTPSYRLFPDAVPDTNQVIQSMQANSFAGILVTSRLPSETRSQYVQGYVTRQQNMRYDRSMGRFVTYYRDVEHAGYIDSQKVNIRIVDVWSTRDEEHLIWSGTSRTPESNSLETVRPEIIKQVITDLMERGIIASGR